jgi:hypothetical protein
VQFAAHTCRLVSQREARENERPGDDKVHDCMGPEPAAPPSA